MVKIKEKDWENYLVRKLQEWGWTKLDTIARQNNYEVIDQDILSKQLIKLDFASQKKIVDELIRFPSSYDKIVECNYKIYQKLNKSIDYFEANSQSYKKVYLIDQDWEKNDFNFVQQFKVENPANKEFVVFDLVLFINGIPLTIIEVKNWSDDESDWEKRLSDSLKQIKRYEKTVPHIFNYLNFATVSVVPHTFYYGICGKNNPIFYPWKEEENNYLFARQNFFDICQTFTLYDRNKDKFIIRYYQLRTIHEISLETNLLGVIRHATGSGKSFLMICFVNWLRKQGKKFCYLFVVDRCNLVEQFFNKFENFNPLAEFNCLKIATGKLFSTISRKQADNSIFFTTIQKFNQEIKKNVPPNKFLVIVDEAHRSQHGEFAQIMRSLLPNAAFLGLTATPITKKERITSEAFGEKEYIYTSTQSVREGFNVPLFYKLIKDQAILENNPSLRKQWKKILEENQGWEEEAVKKILNKQTNLETLISSPKRLDWIVKKFFQIYQTMKEEAQTEVFKVMFIAYSSKIVESLYWRMKNYSPHVIPIISSNKELSKELKEIIANNKENIDIFSSSKNKVYQIALVLDMLNVGFDMPCLQAIFLDTPKSEDHDIFQTISRPNRIFSGKSYGTIIDFLGITDNVVQAVKKYDTENLLTLDQGAKQKIKESVQRLKEIYDGLEKNIEQQLRKGNLKAETDLLLLIADQLEEKKEQWKIFLKTCQEIEKYKFFWKVGEEVSEEEKRFLQRSLEIFRLILGKSGEGSGDFASHHGFKNLSNLEIKIKARLQEIVEIVPPQQGEERELWLIGGDLTKLNNIKKKWAKEIIINRLKGKLNLLLSILSEEDKFVRKFINLLERYNSELEWEVSEVEGYEKELEEKITWYKQNPEQFLSEDIYQLLKTSFPTKEPNDLRFIVEEILKSTATLRRMLDWNKRWEIQKDVRNKVWIICYRGINNNTAIVDSIINILEQKEAEIQEFNHKYKELFLN
ncbi:MAG: type I deoxyribonuclease HsdR [Mycoplasmataceae bacterium RV_VA103A]|nr:MAG: type I deoxyribonuclease HsdR [Mycoplasmataceae bacterium RV_VA103A]